MTVLRDSLKVVLNGTLPPPREYDAFPHPKPSGMVQGYRIGNDFSFVTDRVIDFSIYLNREMVNFSQPVTIRVNDQILFDDIVVPDAKMLLQEFLKSRDRTLFWSARIDIKL